MLNSISTIKADLGIESNGRVQRTFTETCKRHMDKYLPFDTGATANSGLRDSSIDSITYQTPYAAIIYRGISYGMPINFHKDKHPLATAYWDKKMVSAEIEDVIREVRNYVGGNNG